MKNFWNSICDFLWVLQAFLRGKVLRQKAYQPIILKSQHFTLFRMPIAATCGRLVMLMCWWGHNPAGIEDIKKMMEEDGVTEMVCPYLEWTGEGGWQI